MAFVADCKICMYALFVQQMAIAIAVADYRKLSVHTACVTIGICNDSGRLSKSARAHGLCNNLVFVPNGSCKNRDRLLKSVRTHGLCNKWHLR